MTSSFYRILGVFFALLFLQGCFPGFKEEKQKDRDVEKIQKLTEVYNSFQGTYKGDLINGTQRFPIVLNMVVGQVQNGVYEGGQLKFIPQMNLSFKRIDKVGEPTRLVGTVSDPESSKETTGTFKIVEGGPNETNPNELGIASIKGTFIGERYVGDIVTSQGQILGTFDLTRQGEHETAPINGSDEEVNRQWRAIYDSIKGTYKGNLITDQGPIPIRIRIFYNEITSTGKTKPDLMAFYRRMDVASPSFPLTGTYDQNNQDNVVFTGNSQVDPTLDLNLLNFRGELKEIDKDGQKIKVYKGLATIRGEGANPPTFELIKQEKDDSEDVDTNQQYINELKKVYEAIKGTYRGFVTVDGSMIPLSVRLFYEEKADPASGKNKPLLLASFRRRDVVSYSLPLSGTYKQDLKQLVLTRQPSGNDADTDLNIVNFNGVIGRSSETGIPTPTYEGQVTMLGANSASFKLFKQEQEDPVPTDEDEAYKQELEQVFEFLKGSYRGDVAIGGEKIPIRVRLSYKDQYDNIAKKNRVVLIGSFRRMDIPSYEYDLDGAYKQSLQQLVLSRVPNGSNPNLDLNITTFNGILRKRFAGEDVKPTYEGRVTVSGAGGSPFTLVKQSEDDPLPPDAEEQYKKELEQVFLKIKGTYKGSLKSEGRDIPIRFQMFYRQVLQDNGKNFPTLFGSFRRTDIASPEFYLSAIYRPELHRVIFSKSTTSSQNLDLNLVNFEGELLTEKDERSKEVLIYQGEAKRPDNGIKVFRLIRQEKEEILPPDGSMEQYKKELQAQLQVLAGKWYGFVDFPKDSKLKDMKIVIDLQVKLMTVDGVSDFPVLEGLHDKMGEDIALVFRQILSVNYDTSVSPAKVTMNGHSWKPQSPYFVNIIGTYSIEGSKQIIKATWSDYRNNVIPIQLTRNP